MRSTEFHGRALCERPLHSVPHSEFRTPHSTYRPMILPGTNDKPSGGGIESGGGGVESGGGGVESGGGGVESGGGGGNESTPRCALPLLP